MVILSMQMDWDALWKAARRDASLERHNRDKVKFWNRRAVNYNDASHNGAERIAQITRRFDITKETTVLDVGAGTGVLAIPLAKIAGSVTAIDPSSGMLDELKTAAARERLDNITCLERRWEDVSIGEDITPHDLVIASFSLIMLDIRAALEKMHAAASRAVCLFWFAGPVQGANEDLWPRLYGRPCLPGPDYIYLLNVLYQMGVYPDVEIRTSDFKHYYDNPEAALDDLLSKLNVSRSEDISIVRDYLVEALKWDGARCYLQRPSRTAMLWWQK
jgi:SAM-dependent methyltransferase